MNLAERGDWTNIVANDQECGVSPTGQGTGVADEEQGSRVDQDVVETLFQRLSEGVETWGAESFSG